MQHFSLDRRNFPGGHPSRDYSMASTLNYRVPIHVSSLKRVGQLLKDHWTLYLYTRELRSVTSTKYYPFKILSVKRSSDDPYEATTQRTTINTQELTWFRMKAYIHRRERDLFTTLLE